MSAIKPTKGENLFQIFNYIFLIILSLTFILPFAVVISTSFVSEQELIKRGSFILFPHQIDITAYKLLLGRGSAVFNAYKITIFRVVVGTFLNLVFTSFLSFGLSKKSLPGRNTIIAIVFITMIFSGGLIPTYLLVKSLNLMNSIWSMIIPGLVSAWNMIIMKNFFAQIPESLEESAVVDGATPFVVLTRIIFPISLPVFATIGLFYAVGHWNAWFDAVIYINDSTKMPLQVIMRSIVLSMSSQDVNDNMLSDLVNKPPAQTVKSAVIVVTTLPILAVYPFLQKYFIKGMIVGSVKG